MNNDKNKNIKQDQGSQSDTRTPPAGQPMRQPQQGQDADTQRQGTGVTSNKPGVGPDVGQDKNRQ